MSRNVAITAIDGHTGFAIAELLLTNNTFSSKIDPVVALSLNPKSPRAKELEELAAKIIPHKHGHERENCEVKSYFAGPRGKLWVLFVW